MFSILDRYIGKTIVSTTLLSLLVLTGLSGLIRFVEQVRSIGRGTYSMSDVLAYVLLNIPRDIEMFFPMATLLGGLIGMGLLASNSELTVMLSAGRSRLQLIGSAMKSAILMMLAVLALGEWLAPQLETEARQLRSSEISGGSLIRGEQGIWARDGAYFVHISQAEDTGRLNNIAIYEFSGRHLQQVVRGAEAVYREDAWVVMDARQTIMGESQLQHHQHEQWRWESELTPDKLGVVTVRPESLPISGLRDYIGYLEANNQDTSRYELAFWRKILAPLTVAVMLLVALAFIFGPLRTVTMGARVLMGVITGFAFYMIDEVFGPVSQVYQVPPLLGALLPGVIFASMALYLLTRRRV